MAKVKNRNIVAPYLDVLKSFEESEFEDFITGDDVSDIDEGTAPSPRITQEKKFRQLYEHRILEDWERTRNGIPSTVPAPNRYVLKAPLKKTSSVAEKQYSSLIEIIKQDFTYSKLIVDYVYPRSSIVLGELEIEILYTYFWSGSGDKSLDWENMSDFVMLKDSLIFPYQNDKDKDSLGLRIPSAIYNRFYRKDKDKDKDKLEFYLGTYGLNTDDLYLFPVGKDKKLRFVDIRKLDTHGIIEPENVDRAFLTIWKNPINITPKGDGHYLNLPNEFFEITEYDSMDISNFPNAPEKPGFILSYDIYGNLRFQRVLFTTDKNNKLQYPLEFALYHDNPEKVKLKKISSGGKYITDDISIDDLKGTKRLNSLIEMVKRERQL